MGTGDNAGLFVNASRRDLLEAVDVAFELGVNYFDTAPDYGLGIAESNLGWVLRQIGYRPTVVTKAEYYMFSLANLRVSTIAGCEASLARLGMDHVDILMVHNPPTYERKPEDANRKWIPLTVDEFLGPVRSALQELQSSGKVRYVGFACENANPAPVKEVIASGLFDVVNLGHNLANPSARAAYDPGDDVDLGGVLDEIERHHMGCAVIRPLAGGALTTEAQLASGPQRHPNASGGYANPASFQRAVDRARRVATLADALGISPAELGYRFLLADPAVNVIIGGFSDVHQLRSSYDWVQRAREMREDPALQKVLADLAVAQ